MYIWHFEVILQYYEALMKGFLITLELSLLSIVIALVLGTMLGVARVYLPDRSLRTVIAWLVELLRAMPKIVLLVWFFYAFPVLTGLHLPAFETALAGLSIVSAAFVAEIVRAGIEAVPKGQIEAARMLGMSNIHTIRSIVLPQVFMRNAPAFMGEFSTTIKDSAIAVVIGVGELLHMTNEAAVSSYRPLELYTFLGLLFLALIIPTSILSKKVEFREITKARSRKEHGKKKKGR